MSAVHPNLSQADRLSIETYHDVLGRLAKARTRQPCTAEDIHRVETGERLPVLAQRMKTAYAVDPSPSAQRTPRLASRGARSVACGSLFTTSVSPELGVCTARHVK
jgi:hypothetical protein